MSYLQNLIFNKEKQHRLKIYQAYAETLLYERYIATIKAIST